MSRCRPGLLLLPLLLNLAAAHPARAGGDGLNLRFALIFEEAIDGKPATANRVEAELTKRLIDAGMILVDKERALAIKNQMTVKKLLEAEDLTRLTAFDADVVIVGRTESNNLGKGVMGTSWMSYEVQGMLRVVRTDTAQIMFAPSEATTGVDLNPTGAVRQGAEKMAVKLTRIITAKLEQMADQFGGLTVTIAGLPEYSDFSSVLASLKTVEGVSQVRPRRYSKDASLVELAGKGLSGDATAAAITAVRADLKVEQASSRAVTLRFKPDRAVLLPVAVARFGGPARPAAVAALRGTAPALLETALADANFLDVIAAECKRPEARGKKAVARLAKKTGAAVVLTGEIIGKGKNQLLAIKALAADGGKALLTRKAKLGQDPLAAVETLSKGLADELLERALNNKKFVKRQQLGGLQQRVAAGPAAGPDLRVTGVSLTRVFPSRMRSYAEKPLGKATIKNRGKGAAKDLVISVEVPGLTRLPTEQTLAALAPGKTAEVDLKVTFDPDALFKVEETRPSQLAVTVVYSGGDVEKETRSVKPLTVVSRNALDWREPASAAAFVTPKDTAVMEFAKAAAAQAPEGKLPRPVRVAAALYSAMAALPMRYNPDPSAPFGAVILDDVQFARDTLRYRSGDCDDLSVLTASLLEALGVPAALITTPGHVLVGLDTGLPGSAAADLSADPGRVVVRGGKAWMPLEATRLPKDFAAAWASGAEELSRRAKGAEWIPIEASWQSHPPIPLPAGRAARFPDAAKVKAAAATAVAAVTQHAAESLDRRIAKLKKKSRKSAEARNELGQLLARRGDLKGAEALFRENLTSDKNPARAHNNLANVLVLSDRAAEASREYNAAAKFGSSRGSIYANLAVAMYLDGDAAGATESYARSITSGGQEALGAAGLVVDETRGRTAAEKGKKDVSVPDLQYLIDCALKKVPADSKKIKYKAGQPLGARRGVEAEQKELLRLLFWL